MMEIAKTIKSIATILWIDTNEIKWHWSKDSFDQKV